MMLLQCPRFFRSPSRNQTPSAILVIVSGLASEFPAKKASAANAPNPASSPTRAFFITAIKCTFRRQANAMVKSVVSGGKRMAAKPRRTTPVVDIGGVKVGGNHPIVVQSMTNTDTEDVTSTVNQVMALASAGSELVRVTVNTEKAAAAVPKIVDCLHKFGVRVPIIGDFHYNGHLLLKKFPDCARALSKYRINPGNVNIGKKHDDNFRIMIETAVEYDRPVRIGVNWGSLDGALLAEMMDVNARRPEPKDAGEVTRDAIVLSAIRSAEAAEHYGLAHDKIILSAKVSGVQDLIAVYRDLAAKCDYALHLGLTEAGLGSKGIVATTAALSVLLQEGIGDTIRASLTPLPNGDRTDEVIVS